MRATLCVQVLMEDTLGQLYLLASALAQPVAAPTTNTLCPEGTLLCPGVHALHTDPVGMPGCLRRALCVCVARSVTRVHNLNLRNDYFLLGASNGTRHLEQLIASRSM